jgi:hypothetical protein
MRTPRTRRARKPPSIVLVEGEAVDSPRERDETVERLLRQSLGTPQRGVTDACLDAETLAAWTAGGLSGSALETVQLHVADCARCQSMAGTLARISAAVPQAEPAPRSRRWLAWFIPLTAAATAVALWFAVPGNPGAPQTVASRAPVSEAPASEPFALRDRPPTAPAEPAQVPPAGRQAPESPAAEPAPQAAEVRREKARSNTLDQPAAEGSVAKEEAAGRDLAKDKKVDAFQPAAAAAAATQVAPSNQRERADSAARPALRAAAVAAPEIVSPDPAVRWRILGAAVQHSSNGGSTWETVPIGVAVELTAGVAPATTVCWLVGRNGVVLLTTDGQTWRRLAFPEITDLSDVRTVDAGGHVATVSTADGRTFVTTDAGVTWSAR